MLFNNNLLVILKMLWFWSFFVWYAVERSGSMEFPINAVFLVI